MTLRAWVTVIVVGMKRKRYIGKNTFQNTKSAQFGDKLNVHA